MEIQAAQTIQIIPPRYHEFTRMTTSTHFSWNCRKPGLTWGLAFSSEVVARGEVAGILGMEGGKLGDRSGQLLPGLERRGRAIAPWHSQAGHLHGRRLGHGNGGSQLIRGTIIGILALVERGLWFNLQVGSEVEANDREVIHPLDALKYSCQT